ncbi:hypothetical protein [Kribbella sp. NPDC004536]|uniref:hypothetical protein n=1 Tax=Kribbella sp. NPDC004536 TaxID=3364106 RepID=UPI0036CD4B94
MTLRPLASHLIDKRRLVDGGEPDRPGITWHSPVLLVVGALPVSSIPLHVSGLLDLRDLAVFAVVPAVLVVAFLLSRRTPETRWALRGLLAGLVAVAAYDCLRLPLVWLGVMPDFIPRLGGWVSGQPGRNALLGYLWRYAGDGGGIGMAYFTFCGVIRRFRPGLVDARPLVLSTLYGVGIWSGLLITAVALPRGQEMMFEVTPSRLVATLAGHLVYGLILGLFLRRSVERTCVV